MGVINWIKNLFSSSVEEIAQNQVVMSAGYGYPYGFDVGYGGEKWPYGLSASGYSPTLDHYTTRQNARNAYHSNMQARSIVDRYADVVVDTGLKLESTPAFEQLGIDEEESEAWSKDVETRFNLWASTKSVSRDEQMTFYQMQRLAEVFRQRDNDYFVRFYYSKSQKLLNPLQISFIDPNQIRGDAITSTYGFQGSYDGIKRDAAGKEIAYNIYEKRLLSDGNQEYVETVVPAIGPRSGLRMMIHGFQPEYAGQTRGFSRLHHAIQYFENITDFETATIKKAINQSNLVLSVTPSKDNPASNIFKIGGGR